MRQKLWISARAVVVGWAVLLVLAFLVERPLLIFAGPLLFGSWLPTAKLAADCIALAATGWAIGRVSRPHSLYGVLVFAVTLVFWDLEPFLPINVPWLLRLMRDALGDSRYVDSLFTGAVNHAVLFGCLIGGGLLARRSGAQVVSISGRGAD